MRFESLMISCRERSDVRAHSLASLQASDWAAAPEVVLDDESAPTRLERIHHTWRRVLERTADSKADFLLLLEDDVTACYHLQHNLFSWKPLLSTESHQAFYAALYNPGVAYQSKDMGERYMIAVPHGAWASQAIVTTPRTAGFILRRWDEAQGNPDQRMPRIASRVTSIFYHVPSLFDHVPAPSTWGGIEHRALDFEPAFRAALPLPCAGRLERAVR